MHNVVMRSHTDIIEAIGVEPLADLTGKSIHTARSWVQRKRIPAEYWLLLVSEGLAKPEELMAGVAADRAA